ncbi:uridine kinase [Arthrobacter sp. zg-Y40]|uniref:uridine kinase n=1 Tax=Arthrobacter sp. zg-Y40 TaxID=2886939 RepID=UPI001D143ECD|nr:uridine kinase [Arthrobacter sp. zg-Y40]
MRPTPTPPLTVPPGPPADRNTVLAHLARVLLALQPSSRLLMAVDGVDGAGKTTFADELASALRASGAAEPRQVLRVGLDDFHNVRGVRYRLGRSSPDGFWLDSYNLGQFKEYVLDPLTKGVPAFRDRGHDLETDAVLDPAPVPAAPNAVVLVDGMFLHRDELRNFWDCSVFLDVPFTVTAARLAVRDGSPSVHPHRPGRDRYVGGQQRYFAAADPAARAFLVLENSCERTLQVIDPANATYRAGKQPGKVNSSGR